MFAFAANYRLTRALMTVEAKYLLDRARLERGVASVRVVDMVTAVALPGSARMPHLGVGRHVELV